MAKAIDLSGQKFNRLTVIKRDFSRKGTYWFCQCECGNIKSVRADHLKENRVKSCGCYNKEASCARNFIDEVGNVYGKLTVIERDYSKQQKAYLFCQCSCGNPKLISVMGTDLRSGHTQSCGCLKSKGELKIIQILTSLNVPFIQEKKFDDLRTEKGNLMKFDFYLPTYNCCIEYQGRQHYSYDNHYNKTLEELQQRQLYDQKKVEYCKAKNIKLLVIKYTQYDKLNEEFLRRKLNEDQD